MHTTFALTGIPQERNLSLPLLVSRVGLAATNVLKRMCKHSDAREEKLLACDRLLRLAGWMTMVPLQTGLPFASIVMRGTSLFGVGVSSDDQWSEDQQLDLLDRCAQDGLSGVILMGRPVDMTPALNRVEFLDIPSVRPSQHSVVVSLPEDWRVEQPRTFHEMSVA